MFKVCKETFIAFNWTEICEVIPLELVTCMKLASWWWKFSLKFLTSRVRQNNVEFCFRTSVIWYNKLIFNNQDYEKSVMELNQFMLCPLRQSNSHAQLRAWQNYCSLRPSSVLSTCRDITINIPVVNHNCSKKKFNWNIYSNCFRFQVI